MSIENEDDIDLSAADRGDDLAEFEDKQDDRPARDEKGRFAGKDEAPEDADEEDADEEDAGGEEGPDDEEEDEGAEVGDAKGKVKDDKNYSIRLRKAQEKLERERQAREDLERRLSELEAKSKAADKEAAPDPRKEISDQLDALYEQVEEARADGETKEAAKLQREIDSLNRKLGVMEAEQIARNTARVSTEDQRFDVMLGAIEAGVDALKPGHEDFDAEAVKELEFQVAAYERMGMAPTKALAKAVKVLHAFELGGAKRATEAAPEKEKPQAKKPDVAKAVDTTRRQPPDASNRGVNRDGTKIKVATLSDDDFDKLPESKKAELRGDHI